MTQIIINSGRLVSQAEFARLIHQAMTERDTNTTINITDTDRVAELEEIITALRELAVAQQRLHEMKLEEYLTENNRLDQRCTELEYQADEAYAHGRNDERNYHSKECNEATGERGLDGSLIAIKWASKKWIREDLVTAKKTDARLFEELRGLCAYLLAKHHDTGLRIPNEMPDECNRLYSITKEKSIYDPYAATWRVQMRDGA